MKIRVSNPPPRTTRIAELSKGTPFVLDGERDLIQVWVLIGDPVYSKRAAKSLNQGVVQMVHMNLEVVPVCITDISIEAISKKRSRT